MTAVQAEDVRASYLFVGDLNCHRQEWLGSMKSNLHEVAATTSQQSPVAISWLSARPMHMV